MPPVPIQNTGLLPCINNRAHSVLSCVEILYVGQLRHNQHLLCCSETGAESTETLLDVLWRLEAVPALLDDVEFVSGLLVEVGCILNLSQFHCRVLFDERLERPVSPAR